MIPFPLSVLLDQQEPIQGVRVQLDNNKSTSTYKNTLL